MIKSYTGQDPWIKFKIGDGDEFDPCEQIEGLYYLGEDTASSSPQFTNTYQDRSGVDGSFFIGQTFAKRTFSEKFWLHFTDWADFQLAIQQVYHLFGARKEVRVRTDMYPQKVYFGNVTPFDITPLAEGGNDATFSIPFEVSNGYRYSLYRSNAYEVNSGETQIGMNFPSQKLQYHFANSTSFKVYNASDLKVDPYYQNHDIKTTVKFGGNSIEITNKTTGSSWKYGKESGKTIVINGINTYEDGNNANLNTDGGYLDLNPGWNEFAVSGASNADITFSFPFIYLM